MTRGFRQASGGRQPPDASNEQDAFPQGRHQQAYACRSPGRRRGLAPLELVLALPLMLFVMALMVNIGAVGAWKVREQTNARYASYRTMHLRSGDWNPNPPMWPSSATLNGGTGDDLQQTEPVWNGLPDLRTPAVRGPVVVESTNGRSIRVNRMLEMKDDVHDGRAPLERQIPLLRGILPNNGRYRFHIPQNVLDETWEFHNLGYAGNRVRRAKRLYQIEPEHFPSSRALKSQLDSGPLRALRSFPLRRNLNPLDADPDLSRLSILPPRVGRPPPRFPSGVPPPPGEWSPDFYPVLDNPFYPIPHNDGMCEANPNEILTHEKYQRFLEEVRHLPGYMAGTFLDAYSGRRDYLLTLASPSPADVAEINWLNGRLDELRDFINGLPPQNR